MKKLIHTPKKIKTPTVWVYRTDRQKLYNQNYTHAVLFLLLVAFIAIMAYLQNDDLRRKYEVLSADNARLEMMMDSVLMPIDNQ